MPARRDESVRTNAIRRRRVLGAGLIGVSGMASTFMAGSATPIPVGTLSLGVPKRMARLYVDADGALLAVSLDGELWRLASDSWRLLGQGLDPSSLLASGHRRVVGRGRDGGLWVLESGRASQQARPRLAPHAGLLMLALGVIAVAVGREGRHHVIRLEPGASGWSETARSKEVVLPDARPVQFDPSGTTNDDNGHVAVFGGPDAARYRHGVLGDDIEATSLLLLERHGMETMARLDLPAPFVFEDIAPRPIAWQGRRGLLTVRSGPQGAQLAVAAPAGGDSGRFALAALGAPIGAAQRWLSPSTDGVRLLAVHTPHLGGVLHRYRLDGDRLMGEVVARDVTNHMIGHRELDMSAWVDRIWVVPKQDRRGLRFFAFDSNAGALRSRDMKLELPVLALHRWQRHGQAGVAVLLQNGSVAWTSATP
jgi:hypothetical protein